MKIFYEGKGKISYENVLITGQKLEISQLSAFFIFIKTDFTISISSNLYEPKNKKKYIDILMLYHYIIKKIKYLFERSDSTPLSGTGSYFSKFKLYLNCPKKENIFSYFKFSIYKQRFYKIKCVHYNLKQYINMNILNEI